MPCISFLELPWQSTTNLDGFKKHKFIVSQFWMPQVPNQGVGKATLPVKALGGGSLLASSCFWWSRNSLACCTMMPISASIFTWPSSLYLYLCPSYKDIPGSPSHLKILNHTYKVSSMGGTLDTIHPGAKSPSSVKLENKFSASKKQTWHSHKI